MDDKIGKRERRVVDEKYNRGAKYLDDLELNEPMHFCYRWLNLPNALQILKLFEDYLGDRAIKKVKVKRVTENYKSKKDKLKKVKIVRV